MTSLGPGSHATLEPDASLLQLALVSRRDASEERRNLYRFLPDGRAAALEPRQVEEVSDDPLESMGFLRHDLQVPLTGRGVHLNLGHG